MVTPLSQRVDAPAVLRQDAHHVARTSEGAQAPATLPSSVSRRVTASPIRKPARLSQADSQHRELTARHGDGLGGGDVGAERRRYSR